jgi:hypothetical protein
VPLHPEYLIAGKYHISILRSASISESASPPTDETIQSSGSSQAPSPTAA